MKNYKTTLAGFGVIFTALGNAIAEYAVNSSLLDINLGTLIGAISGGIGLILAKDFNVTGAKK